MATHTRTRQVWLVILAMQATWAGTIAVLHGRAADTKRESGIYLETADTDGKDGPKRLEASMPQMEASGVGASMATMGFKRPKMLTKLSGDKAALRVAPESTFLFVFGNRARTPQQMMEMDNPMAAMSALPPNTSSPKDFALILLAIVDGDRVYDSGKGKQVKCAVENVEPKVFRIKPTAPLEPGEYGFAWMQNGIAGMVWDFGVDGAAKNVDATTKK